jgi:hypothetical protein
MGLDAVELILRAEDFYVMTIGDEEAAAVRTVGDFYKVICAKLDVSPLENPLTSDSLPVVSEKEWGFLFLRKRAPLPAPPGVLPWTPQSVWDSLVALVVDQLSVRPSEVVYHASFAED